MGVSTNIYTAFRSDSNCPSVTKTESAGAIIYLEHRKTAPYYGNQSNCVDVPLGTDNN